jgi:hypothetical protein
MSCIPRESWFRRLGQSFRARPRDAVLALLGLALIVAGVFIDSLGLVLVFAGAAFVFLGLFGERITQLKFDKSGVSLTQDLTARDAAVEERFSDDDVQCFTHFATLLGAPAADVTELVTQAIARVYERWPDVPVAWRESSVFCELCHSIELIAPAPVTAPGPVIDLTARAASLDYLHRQAFLLTTVAMTSEEDGARLLGVSASQYRELLADISGAPR